ncbi:ABC transporter permease [Domibacillus sp. PGB-M46]|uniref:ABC transporter permease n=1 Tax=Domibacillus sp. PGB-M46 TaxID=2910255 RepID=UPI001F581667|nr:ABC transporter permease [Domibacillus sp. PGB-M46]MCI2255755.1 ABC transporter permease [Domibacillus sp. PGB-M46]
MILFVLKRFYEACLVLFIGSICCFLFIRMLPGDPAVAVYGGEYQKLSEAERIRISENLGLNEPLPAQYMQWLSRAVQGEWGTSSSTGEDVREVIGRTLQPTFLLLIVSQLLIFLFSFLPGIISGLRRRSSVDYVITVVSFLFMSIPSFWLALLLMLFFSVSLGLLPTSGTGTGGITAQLPYVVMPAFILAVSHIGYYIRLLRNHVMAVKEQPFITALRARGISERVILWRHIVPNAFMPYFSYAGASLASALAGTVVVETIFSWPGLGRLTLDSALDHDYSVLMAAILLSMTAVITVNFIIDVIGAAMNPRLRSQIRGAK